VARFARAVHEHGSAAFGSYHVSPRLSLRRYDYMAAYATGRTRCPPGQWMLMGAIQDSVSPAGFDASVDASWTAFLSLHEGANPHQIATLLRDTGMYARVDWEAVVMPRLPFAPDPWRPSLADAEALAPGPAGDVILDINDGFLPGASPAPKGIVGDLERDQPNHFVALVSPRYPDPARGPPDDGRRDRPRRTVLVRHALEARPASQQRAAAQVEVRGRLT
jgi:hypothetical protein